MAKPAKPPGTLRTPVQVGARLHPTSQPPQQQPRPGRESEMTPAPQYLAPDYVGSGKLAGFTALVTGGDSGIGRAVAVLFAREGADIAIAFHTSVEDAETTARHVEDEGRRSLLLQCDVQDAGWCDLAAQRTVQAFGRLDVLVNNAAFQAHAESLEEIDDASMRHTFDTNIGGYFRMARAALRYLPHGGSIINTGSVVGFEGSEQLLDYAATKGAIHTFTKALARNVIDRGIRVNAVAPGPVWTPLNVADGPPSRVARFGSDTLMGRAAQPEELSPAFVFLASPVCSGYITGIVLPVTGRIGAY